MLSPVAAYRNLRDRFAGSIMLESADYHDKTDSKSFICLDPIATFEINHHKCLMSIDQIELKSLALDPDVSLSTIFQDFIRNFSFNSAIDEVNKYIGFYGYNTFEAVQYMENIRLNKFPVDQQTIPAFKYQLFRYVLMFNHHTNELTTIGIDFEDRDRINLDQITDMLVNAHSPDFKFYTEEYETSPISDDTYRSYVQKGIKHCQLGDVFQIVLSRRFQQSFKGDDFQVYRALRSINPSPYLFYFDFGDFHIFGSSPEAQLKITDSKIEIHPIAGTIRRGQNSTEDSTLSQELLADTKEKSEHVMLVDLARNDLNRCATDVHVETFKEVQYFSHVIHMVSKVVGNIDQKTTQIKAFADTFPAGTLSGAPKYKAMELIHQTEETPRSFYGGSIGFFGIDGSVNQAILIRSFLSQKNKLTYQAGAGITVNSKPDKELSEVENKIGALRLAIKKATTL